ncbi:MAG: HAD family hydrolase [Aestuariibacter sp.]
MSLLRNKKAILFDHDGTLVDSEGIYYQLWRQLLKLTSEQFTPEMYKKHCVGIPILGNADYLIERFSLTSSRDELVAGRGALSDAYLAQQPFPMMSGANEILALFKQQNIRMAVVSGSERKAVLDTVVGHGFEGMFEVIATGDQVTNNKPAPDVYLYCLQQMELQASDCIAIEDTEHGVQAAHAAGIEVIAVPNQYTLEHDFTLATTVLPELTALSKLL